MNDIESRLRDAGREVREVAGDLASERPWPGSDASTAALRRPRFLVGSVAAGIVILGLVALVVTRSSTPSEPSAPDAASADAISDPAPEAAPDPAPTIAPASSAPATGEVAPATDVETPVTADADPAPISRPVFDPAVCAPVSAAAAGLTGLPLHPNRSPVTVFGWPSAEPVPVQVFAVPGAGVDGPYAVVAHVRSARDLSDVAVENTEGRPLRTVPAGDGSLDVVWDLPDGTRGVLRSRALDVDAIYALVDDLEPRSTTGAPDGFELNADVAGLSAVAEELNTEMVSDGVGSTCVAPTGRSYRVWGSSGSEAYNYMSSLARPTPVDIAERAGTIWIVSGPDDPGAPRVEQLLDADEAAWSALLDADAPSAALAFVPGESTATTLTPVGDANPTSTIDVRVELDADRVSLHIETSSSTLPPGAAFWVTAIDGRVEGISSVPGGTLTFPLDGNVEEFDVLLAAVDVDGQPVAATDELTISVAGR